MRTVIVRLAEPEQTGGALHGLVEVPGQAAVPFSGAGALLDLITAAVRQPPARPRDADEPHCGDPT